jgi:hypothetical protein
VSKTQYKPIDNPKVKAITCNILCRSTKPKRKSNSKDIVIKYPILSIVMAAKMQQPIIATACRHSSHLTERKGNELLALMTKIIPRIANKEDKS